MNDDRKETQKRIVEMLEMLTMEELVSLHKIITLMIGKYQQERKYPDIGNM
jgi:hypothetical protein